MHSVTKVDNKYLLTQAVVSVNFGHKTQSHTLSNIS